jgi:ribose transport system permease protein
MRRRFAFRALICARSRLWSSLISGTLSGLVAVAYCARLASVDSNAGSGFELEAIAAVVIGGTSLVGGRGSVVNSLFGVLVISVLETGLAQLGAQEPVKQLVTGGVIVAAVMVNFYQTRQMARRTVQ